MKMKLLPLLFASSFLMVACDQSTHVVVTKENAVAEVNGVYISKEALETLSKEIQQRSHGRKFPKKQLLEELIQRELLVQDAKQKKLDQSKDVAARIDMATRSLLSQATLQDYLKSSPVTDADIKAEYDKEVAKTSGIEYKARHILLKTEAKAKEMIALLKGGAQFEELAKKHSTGPSGPQGGSLGWFADGQMVKSFSDAVIALENGAYTSEAIKTQFGWHIILRENSRDQTPPPFDSIKAQLRPNLEQKKIQTMLETLREKAKVDILISVEEPKQESPEVIEKQAKTLDAVEAEDIKPTEEIKAKATVTTQETAPKIEEAK